MVVDRQSNIVVCLSLIRLMQLPLDGTLRKRAEEARRARAAALGLSIEKGWAAVAGRKQRAVWTFWVAETQRWLESERMVRTRVQCAVVFLYRGRVTRSLDNRSTPVWGMMKSAKSDGFSRVAPVRAMRSSDLHISVGDTGKKRFSECHAAAIRPPARIPEADT